MIGSLPPVGIASPYLDRSRSGPDRPAPEQDSQDGARADATTPADSRDPTGLSEAELAQLRELQARDREVRAHEMAHVIVGGSLVLGGASFTYETGPDGQRYAVGGEVRIDTSPGRTPEETLDKAERIRAAALAPADPSPQDRQIAAMAMQMAMQAQIEIAIQRREDASDMPARSGPVNLSPSLAERVQASYANATPNPAADATINIFA